MNLMRYLNESVDEKTLNDVGNLGKKLVGMNFDADPQNHYPISVESKSTWETLVSPERLRRIYKFENPREVIYFVNELYKYQFKIDHHFLISIENLQVTVETYTHDLNGVTQQDIKVKKMADDLFEDLNYIEK